MMKPTIINNASTGSGANAGSAGANTNPIETTAHIKIPVPHEYSTPGATGSPGGERMPAGHFQRGFGFEPDLDVDMDMFPRSSRLGRMHHDPFAGFGGAAHKRSGHNAPMGGSAATGAGGIGASGFPSDYFDHDSANFGGFPRFGTLGSRMRGSAAGADDDDFFNRLPSEFRQYIPESFGQHHRRSAGMPPQSPSKKHCDAAIQTETGGIGRSEIDGAMPSRMRNTVDLGGMQSAPFGESNATRAQSAPPTEQQQPPPHHRYPQKQYSQQQQAKQATPPPAATQQSSSSTAQPQTPGGSYERVVPIYIEGRTEPLINTHRDVPQQQQQQHYAPPQARAYTPPRQYQQHQQQARPQQRPTPLNTQQQQQPAAAAAGMPPQTPHSLDSIKKIQDIQRDVLELMSKVEQFKGLRGDKEYAYLDEMLTRNLLKLDTIETNGKDSIRMARKEAIKCIEASISVLEAKAASNAQQKTANDEGEATAAAADQEMVTESAAEEAPQKSASKESCVEKQTKEGEVEAEPVEMPVAAPEAPQTPQPVDISNSHEAIPLPAPPGCAAQPEAAVPMSVDEQPNADAK